MIQGGVQGYKVVGELADKLGVEQAGCVSCEKAAQLAVNLRQHLLQGIDHEPVALLDAICRLMSIPVDAKYHLKETASSENSPDKVQAAQVQDPHDHQQQDLPASSDGNASGECETPPPSRKTRNWLAEEVASETSEEAKGGQSKRKDKVYSDASLLSYEIHTCRCRGIQRREASVQCTRDDIEDVTCQIMSNVVTARSVDTARSITFADWMDPSKEDVESSSKDSAGWQQEWNVLNVPNMIGNVIPKLLEPFDFLKQRNIEVIHQAMTPRDPPKLSQRGQRHKAEEEAGSEREKNNRKIEQMIRRGQTDQEIVAKLRFIRGVTEVSFSRVKEVRRNLLWRDVDIASNDSSPEKDQTEQCPARAESGNGILPKEAHSRVLKLLLKGKTNAQIAKHFSLADLQLDESTIQQFRARSHSLNIVSSSTEENDNATEKRSNQLEPKSKIFTL